MSNLKNNNKNISIIDEEKYSEGGSEAISDIDPKPF